MTLDDVSILRIIDDDSPEETYEHFKFEKKNLKNVLKKLANEYHICDDGQFEALYEEAKFGGVIYCEDYGGVDLKLEVLN